MSKCPNCGTRFSFMDVLKTLNPSSIKCSGCDEYIRSSHLILAGAVALFVAITAAFWFSPWSGQKLTGMPMLVFLAVLGGIFEYGYFYLLSKGVILSNLVPETEL